MPISNLRVNVLSSNIKLDVILNPCILENSLLSLSFIHIYHISHDMMYRDSSVRNLLFSFFFLFFLMSLNQLQASILPISVLRIVSLLYHAVEDLMLDVPHSCTHALHFTYFIERSSLHFFICTVIVYSLVQSK